MTQRTDQTMTQAEQDAEYKVIERAANILDKNLTEGRVYAVIVFDEESPEHRKYHCACISNAEPIKAGVALYATSLRFRDMVVVDGIEEIHADDN